MIRRLAILLFCSLLAIATQSAAADKPVGDKVVPRTILALYDSKAEPKIRYSNAHQFAALPLNHLGLVVEYQDIRKPLPDLSTRSDLRGLLIWVSVNAPPDPARFWRWLDGALDRGLKVAMMGDLPVQSDNRAGVSMDRVNATLRRIGFQDSGGWDPVTFGAKLQRRTPDMVDFERAYSDPPPAFSHYQPTDPAMHSHLIAQRQNGIASHLVMTGPRGGFAASGYIFFRDPSYLRTQWQLNPFKFFAEVFDTDALPKADASTLNGRRIYYSHVDGDGWLNLSTVPAYAKNRVPAAEVILHEVAERYSDLPVTIAPVAAELDPDWHGSQAAMRIARQFFALPNVETSSHTYSHPFQWNFFDNYNPAREAPFRAIYNSTGQQRYQMASEEEQKREAERARTVGLAPGYRIPRAYGDKPFDADKEIAGSLDFITRLAPTDKPPRLIQWSGDTSPSTEMLARVRRAGALNINGGDSRFDREYPSYSSVAPLGLLRDGELQVYASNSNENTYTELWTNRFFGQRYVRETWINTGMPRRISAINLYYHIYAGENLASLNALRENLDWLRAQEIAPIPTHRYAEIVGGFHRLRLEPAGAMTWRVLDRGAMQTIRFDGALARLSPDYRRSKGLLGHRHENGALYVSLDPAAQNPEIALSETGMPAAPLPGRPILDNARWQVDALACSEQGCDFHAQGYGRGDFLWRGFAPGNWRASIVSAAGERAEETVLVGENGLLPLRLPQLATLGARIRIAKAAP